MPPMFQAKRYGITKPGTKKVLIERIVKICVPVRIEWLQRATQTKSFPALRAITFGIPTKLPSVIGRFSNWAKKLRLHLKP